MVSKSLNFQTNYDLLGQSQIRSLDQIGFYISYQSDGTRARPRQQWTVVCKSGKRINLDLSVLEHFISTNITHASGHRSICYFAACS
ncbi:hypothetical protein I3760_10G012800 [Carya illinoinensis]|nr:hypothetical protein I3760_10G012800 [Carya illinoinensis]